MKYFLLLTMFIGCAHAEERQQLDPQKFYKRDMIVTVNGATYEGYATIPKAPKYDFHIEARGDLDMFIMSSCHKEEQKEKAWNVKKKVRSGLFGWGSKKIDLKREVKFVYVPNDLEADGDCPVELGGFEMLKGRHSWAFMDFESDRYKLPAKVNCNGRVIQSNGTTVCQSRSGLIQDITFSENVLAADNNECGILAEKGKKFEFALPKGKCSVVFATLKKPRRFHKITLLGYESILIRE